MYAFSNLAFSPKYVNIFQKSSSAVYASWNPFFNVDIFLKKELTPLKFGPIWFNTEPNLASSNKPSKSLNWTWELTTPNSNSSWYKGLSLLKPFTCKALKALLTSPILPKGNNPLAPANAAALIKFLACVNGARIVLAICDVALGYKTKFWYTCAKKLLDNSFVSLSAIA